MTSQPLSRVASDTLARTREIAPIIEAGAERAQAERTLPAETVKALAEAGVFRVYLPREAGGEEADFATQIAVAEEVARADGSAGWAVIANGPAAGFAGAFLGDDAVAEVFAPGRDVCLGGQFAPNGQGEVVDDGFRVTGSWHFGSGTGHSAYVMGGFIPMRDGQPLMLDNGLPDMRVACIPREEITFTDGWFVMGLEGTGSYDYECADVFVRESWTYPLFTREPKRGGAIYRMGIFPITAAGHAAWALGVGRRALDEINTLARERTRMGQATVIAARPTFQRDYIRAEARLRAARLLVIDVFAEAQRKVEAGSAIDIEDRALLRTAATYATEAACNAVDFAHEAAGTSSIMNGSILQRCFRDMHTGTQHAFISEDIYLQSAEVLLGLRDESPSL
jgi:alkylation response protein AidB-like acyl-CoA dehydrogenase